MHSWIYRNRVRLRAIYGPAPALLAYKEESEAPAPDTCHEDAGKVIREDGEFVVHPMPRRRF